MKNLIDPLFCKTLQTSLDSTEKRTPYRASRDTLTVRVWRALVFGLEQPTEIRINRKAQ